ncbi:MAG: DNA topoisomerase IV subunit A [Rickettsiales bacterium]|nr:DNA topoisomerase IV subunit A [Rickettsiales bacterium]
MSKNNNKAEAPIIPVAFKDAIGERYLAYAMSTITSRSLPDVRDGLKPVHRRLLYAMLQLKLDPASGYKKCARVVGDVIGKYHPHGDTAVYDTMVRLAQDFAVRYPLVEGQGNFGSVDGDNAAAMRYTEAKLTAVAMALLEGLKENTVDFNPTYDGSDNEPVVLPSAFPNLLANGSEGIAVGMATSIPPHNAGELCDALLHLIKTPEARIETLVGKVLGPDFPTGGIIVEPRENILKAYETGKGSFRTRAKWEVEKLSHGLFQIIITEIPYQVQKSRLLEKMAELFRAKKLPLLANFRDESAEEIRVVLEPKSRQVDPDMLMESLFKVTELENRFSLNMNVLDATGIPRVMNLREVLRCFLDHRMEVLTRRSEYRLEKIAHRLEILEGFLIAYLNLDEVIRIIREEDEPKKVMMAKWDLSDVQVEAILNMRLRQLRKLEEIEIQTEHDALSQEQAGLEALLKSEELRWDRISEEIKATKVAFGQKTELGARRTQFADAPTGVVVSIEAFVEKEPLTVLYSKRGWIRALKGLNQTTADYKEGDSEQFILNAYTTDQILCFASNGRCYTIGGDKIPRGRGHGEPLNLSMDIESTADIIGMAVYNAEHRYLLASSAGKGFVVQASDMVASTKSGKQVLNPPGDSKGVVFRTMPADTTHIAVTGTSRKLLVFPIDQLPEMKKGQGVTLQKYKDGELTDALAINIEQGLSWAQGENRTRTEETLTSWLGNRAGAGKLPPQGFPRDNKFG